MNYEIPTVSGSQSYFLSGHFLRHSEVSCTRIYSFMGDLSIEKLWFIRG